MRFLFCIPLALLIAPCVFAQDEFERPPIEYSKSTPDNVISRLQAKLDRGDTELKFAPDQGYLPALLQSLRISPKTQMLVFTKTSMQRDHIRPSAPRAVYFNDDAYVGFCQGGSVLEISVADPKLGAVFYTLDQTEVEKPRLVRKTDQCLQCHSTSQTSDIPSHLVRSVFPDSSGQPIFSEGTFRVDHTTPLENRWGGWYVTGTHGDQSHLGNLIIRDKPVKRPVPNPDGHNITDLTKRVRTASYLTPHSDIVALMVFEHQTYVHNLITRANYTTRQALLYQADFNRALKQPLDERLESTTRRIAGAGDDLIEGLLFADEPALVAPIVGTSGFAEEFAALGPRDKQGRSLREFDLKRRMFKYPCSYLIYSPAFDALLPEMKEYLAKRLRAILTGPADCTGPDQKKDDAKTFAHLSPEDRRAIWEILLETKPDLFKP